MTKFPSRVPKNPRIALKHGGGGRAMRTLIEEVFLRGAEDFSIDGVGLAAMADGAALRLGDQYLIVTTDSHVIHPLFFPGGDIGRLSIAGTVNDLAMMGATKLLGLTCGVIIEEGFERSVLERVHDSMRATCREAGVPIVTGDTKVMGKGELDGLVINTAGFALAQRVVRNDGLQAGDRIIVTGTVGDHGLAVMAARNQLALEGELKSDVAPLFELVQRALAAGGDGVVAMKDPTRGGVASALHELAAKAGVGVLVDEPAVPVSEPARAASELLGIDPLHVANEGKALIGVRPGVAEAVLAAVRAHPLGRDAAIIGTAIAEPKGKLVLDTGFGRRLLAEPEGEPLPRIC
ncbi:MAG: hydrogenase expression/formation protein HypE [Myxococcaceae bacterium]|nr:hydrogenase expression/formation protein HypE [Myxococcaceae bacterium]